MDWLNDSHIVLTLGGPSTQATTAHLPGTMSLMWAPSNQLNPFEGKVRTNQLKKHHFKSSHI